MIANRPLAAMMLLSLAGTGFAASKPQVVGINAAVLNDVRIRSAGTPPRPAVLRQRVALADQVQTGQRSQLQVLLLDKSVFTVGANALLVIDRYVYDPNSGRSFAASVAKGAFRFMSGRPDRGGTSSVSTPVATIGIRGTIFDGVVGPDAIAIASGEHAIDRSVRSDPATASLIILRGPGPQAQGNVVPGAITVKAAGQTVSLDQPLLAAYVPGPGMAPIGPFTISLSGLARVQALIFPSLAEHLASRPPIDAAPSYQPATPDRVRPPYWGPHRTESDPGPSYGQDIPGWQSLPTPRPEPRPEQPQSAAPAQSASPQSASPQSPPPTSPNSTPGNQYPSNSPP